MGFETATDIATQLVDSAWTNDAPGTGAATPEASPEESQPQAQPQGEEKPTEAAQAAVSRWREEAFKLAKKFHKDGNLDDKALEDAIYRGYIGAGKSLQEQVELRKQIEKQLEEHKPYRDYYDKLMSNEMIQALYSGKARIVPIEEEETDEMPSWAKSMAETINALSGKLGAEAQAKAQAEEMAKRQQESEGLSKRIDEETATLTKKYPLLNDWIKEAKTTGIMGPELSEIMEAVSKDGVSLTYAVSKYFLENQLPTILKAKETETVNKLKDRAAKKPERASGDVSSKPQRAFKSADDIAAYLVEEAIKNK